MQKKTAPRVVIIGCGFGGLEAARALQKANVSITLIDRSNHHLFQPLLYQVATAGLSAPAIAAPIRHLFRKQANVTTLLGNVSAIDTQSRTITLQSPGTVDAQIGYDHLIVAAGASHSYFGNEHWARYAPGLKTLADAMELRKRILFAFEAAEHEADPTLRNALLTFAVIGGGPTGVEMAGTMAEIARHTLPGEFRRINPASATVLLIEGGTRVLKAMPPELSARAAKQLDKLGVKVMLGCTVTDINADGIGYKHQGPAAGPQARAGADTPTANPPFVQASLACKTVVWAAGVAASALGQQLAQATGCALDRAGRVVVDAHLNVPGHPTVWVIGDLAAATTPHGNTTRPVPGVSPAAKQMGRRAAANILRSLSGQAPQPFVYADYGNLATIGRNAAVVDLASPIGQFRFSGYFAWLFWLFAHIYFLIGFRNRFVVLLDWASAYVTFARHARVVVGQAEPSVQEPPV